MLDRNRAGHCSREDHHGHVRASSFNDDGRDRGKVVTGRQGIHELLGQCAGIDLGGLRQVPLGAGIASDYGHFLGEGRAGDDDERNTGDQRQKLPPIHCMNPAEMLGFSELVSGAESRRARERGSNPKSPDGAEAGLTYP